MNREAKGILTGFEYTVSGKGKYLNDRFDSN